VTNVCLQQLQGFRELFVTTIQWLQRL